MKKSTKTDVLCNKTSKVQYFLSKGFIKYMTDVRAYEFKQ